MRYGSYFFGCGAIVLLVAVMASLLALSGGTPFSPGPLGTSHTQNYIINGFASHADFESNCGACHAPFAGPDAGHCLYCHVDVREQRANAQGIHGQLYTDTADCVTCHTDHKGRAARLTRATFAEIPHNQFGFTLVNHQADYKKNALGCMSCHSFANDPKQPEKNFVLNECVTCHSQHDAPFIADHRKARGEACLACHDGTNRLKDFNHQVVFPLDGKHGPLVCVKCHVNNVYRGTPSACVKCHAEPAVHRGQFGLVCQDCHTAAGWKPAELIRHTFPLDHGGKQVTCQVCHPKNYAAYSCYNCHQHEPTVIVSTHAQIHLLDITDCVKCHPKGTATQ